MDTPTHDPVTGDPLGLPEPDWHLMDPVTGADLAAFERVSAQAAGDQLERARAFLADQLERGR